MTKSPTTQAEQSSAPRHWKVHVEALKQSGLNRAEYCRQHKLSYHALAYWQRKLSLKMTDKETSLVPVPFKPIINQLAVQPDRSALKIILSEKIAVEVGDNFSSATLSRLLATLEGR